MLASVLLLLLVIAVGASIGNVRLSQTLNRAQRAERDTQEKLFEALLAQARGSSLSHRPGQRFASLKVLAEATQLARRLELPPERFFELRNAAILALAVPDLYAETTWDGYPEGSGYVDFDEELAVYVRMDERGGWEVRRVADGQLLYRRHEPRASRERERPVTGPRRQGWWVKGGYLSRDGRFLVVLREEDGRLQVWRLTGAEPLPLFREQDVVAVDCDLGGRQLVLAHGDGDLSLYDLDSGKPLRRLPSGVPAPPWTSVARHPTEPLVAVASFSAQLVQVRHLADGAVLKTLHLPTTVNQVAWHPHGHTLAVSEERGLDIHLYETGSFREVRTLRGTGRGNRLAFNRAGDRLAAWSWDRELQLFDLATGGLLFRTSAWTPMLCPRFSRDGRRLACEAVAGRLGIWQVGDARAYRTLLHQGGKSRFADTWADIGPDNRLLAVQTDDDGIGFWDLGTGQELGRLPPGGHEFPLFLPGPPAALLTGGQPGFLRWPLVGTGGSPVPTLRIGPPETLSRLNVLPTSHGREGQVVTACAQVHRGGADAGGWVFHAERNGSPRCLLKGQEVMNIAVSPEGRWLVTLLYPATDLKVWDAQDGRLGEPGARPIKELPARFSYHPRFSPDGRWLTHSGEHGGLYAVGTWEPGLRFRGRGQFSPDSRLLAVATDQGVIRLLDVATGGELARLEDPNQDAALYHLFTPDGTRLVTLGKGRDGGIHVWDLRAIRRGLKEMGLDWAAPDYPPEPPPPTPLRIEVVP
jgi:WD40 repeat protein